MAKVLVIVDMQKDFMPTMLWDEQERTGALPVADGLKIVPNIVKEAYRDYDYVVATRDFHPGNHSSFKELGGTWPMHCVAGSEGAQLLPEIDAVADIILSKGTNPARDGYSGFNSTPLAEILVHHIRDAGSLGRVGDPFPEVVIVGVATDYCVKATALDAAAMGFETTVLIDCVAGVDEDTELDALLLMGSAGITLRPR